MKVHALIAVATLLTGGALGWLLRGSSTSAPAPPSEKQAQDTKTTTRSARESSNPRVKSEIEKLTGNPSWREDYSQWESADLKTLVDAFLAQSDPIDGLRDPLRGQLDQVILALAKRDLEGTLAWIDGKFPKQRFEFYQSIIGHTMGDRPPLERFDFLEAHGFEPQLLSHFATTLLFNNYSRPMDTQTAIALLAKVSPLEEGRWSAGNCQFAPDFDFAALAQATLTQTAANDGRPPAAFPANFISQWASESPQEAIDFFFTHCTGENPLMLSSNGVHNLLAGVKSGMSSADYGTWLGQMISQQSQGNAKHMVHALFYSELSNPDLLRSALAQVEDAELRSNLVLTSLKDSIGSSHNPDGLVTLRNSLALIDDPAERLAQSEVTIRDVNQRFGNMDNEQIASQHEQIVANLRKELLRLGHTEEELKNLRSSRGQ